MQIGSFFSKLVNFGNGVTDVRNVTKESSLCYMIIILKK